MIIMIILLLFKDDDFEDERRANLLATLAAQATCDPAAVTEKLAQLPTDTYEQCYNNATLALALGQDSTAMTLLDKAAGA